MYTHMDTTNSILMDSSRCPFLASWKTKYTIPLTEREYE